MIVYFLLCIVTVLAGCGIIYLIGIRVNSSAVFLAPVVTLTFWALFLGWGVLLGFAIKQIWIVGWSLTFLLAFIGLVRAGYRFLKSEWVLLAGTIIIPAALMAPYFWYGIQTYPGSSLWDGWSYVAFGQYLSEYPRGTEGGLAPLYQYASCLSNTRFIASALLAFFSPISGALRDAQAASGYFLAWALFIFSSACMYFVHTIHKERGKALLLAYVCITVFSGWILNMQIANNYDNALAISFLPALAGVIYRVDPRDRRGAVTIAGLMAGAIFCYPEMAPVVLCGAALFLLQRILSEKILFREFALLIGIGAVIIVFLTLPYMRGLFSFIHGQLNAAFAQPGQRAGEGYFPQLLSPKCFLSAFWGFGFPAEACVQFTGKIREYIQIILAICFSILAILGLFDLFLRKLWGIGANILLLLFGMFVMIFQQGYSYGAYKFILLNWWGITFAAFSGACVILAKFRDAKYGWIIYAVFIVLLLTNVGLIGRRVVSFDKRFVRGKSSMVLRQVQEIKNIVGEDTVIVNVGEDYANLWAVYYLRNVNCHLLDYHVYMASVVPLMERAKTLDLSKARYILTDDKRVSGSFSMSLLWTGGPYRLWGIWPSDSLKKGESKKEYK